MPSSGAASTTPSRSTADLTSSSTRWTGSSESLISGRHDVFQGAMKNYDFPAQFRAIYDQAVGLYAKGARGAGTYFDKAQTAWLAANGLTPQHVYDYAEDENSDGEPGFAVRILVLGIVVHVLGREPVGREPCGLRLVEVGPGGPRALCVKAHRLIVDCAELGGEIVVLHGALKYVMPAGNQ